MPFRSEAQRRFLWMNHPDIAKRWAHEYPESNKDLPKRLKKAKPKPNIRGRRNRKSASAVLKARKAGDG